MLIHFNQDFNLVELSTESHFKHGASRFAAAKSCPATIWEAQNGQNKTYLSLKSFISPKFVTDEKTNKIRASLNFFQKGNSAIIQLTDPEPDDLKSVGVFLNHDFGFTLVSHTGGEIFAVASVGGPLNTSSKFGIYIIGSVLEVHTYGNRNGNFYYELTPEGWVFLGKDILIGNETATKVTL